MSNFVSGRHFLQTPGPTNLPDRVLRAMDRNAINHRGPEFGALGRDIIAKIARRVPDRVRHRSASFPPPAPAPGNPRSSTRWSPGDRILISRTGQFSHLWEQMAPRLGLDVVDAGDRLAPRRRPDRHRPGLDHDREHKIKAVCVVHSETSTSCMTDIAAVRAGDGPRRAIRRC